MMRDPRIDPKSGDVLRCDPLGFTVTVNLAGKRVHYKLAQHGIGIYAFSMQCALSLKEWRKVMAKAEVIERGEA